MNLVRLIYASRFCDSKFDTQELAKINKSAQKNNKKNDITGSLIFGEDFFLQWIEGGREAVTKTYNIICNDNRHESIVMLNLEEISKREFSDWEMNFVVLTEANENVIREFSTTSRFNPFTMSANNAIEFMKTLRK